MLITGVVIVVLLLFLGVPLWLTFLGISLVVLWGLPPDVLAVHLFNSLDIYALLAVPGFVFAAEVMVRGGMAERLVDWVASFFGRIPGGMPLTTVVAAEVFGAISGSSTATVAAVGGVLYPGLRQSRYSEKFSLGLLTSMGAIAVIIPPSITMILFGAVSGASVGKLFLAGIFPGILIGAVVTAYSVWYALRHDVTARAAPWRWALVLRASRRVAWTMGAPLIIFGGIYSGFCTPTEASIILSIYAVAASMLVYRSFDLRGLWQVTVQSALLTAKIFVIVAAASTFSLVLVLKGIPQNLVGMMLSLGLGRFGILVVINVILLIAGMFMDPNSAIVVLVPLLVPVTRAIGVDIIHFGIIMTVNLAIGMFTPPFGLNLFVGASVFDVPAARVIAGCVPFVLLYIGALLLITYVPALSLWLPGLWH